MGSTSIEWTDKTWNPTVGCSVVSPGCTNCYAMRLAGTRLKESPIYKGLTQPSKAGPVWNGKVERSNWGQFIRPLSWRKPCRVFVNSMSDVFHEAIDDATVDLIFAVMANSRRHQFQLLTKRAARMRDYLNGLANPAGFQRLENASREIGYTLRFDGLPLVPWPVPNVWLGVSVEDQERADERIPLLLDTPAAVRFLSCEPLLGSIDLRRHLSFACVHGDITGIDWIIVGGESGNGARPCDLDWIRSIVAQSQTAGVWCFVKQLGAAPTSIADRISHRGDTSKRPDGFYRHLRDRKGGDISEFPEDLRIRQFPTEGVTP